MADAIAQIRDDFAAAEQRNRAALIETIAQIESRFARDRDEREQSRMATEAAIERLRSSAAVDASDMARVLEHVVRVFAMIDERLDSDRLERRAMLDAIRRLVPPATATPAEGRSQVIGGTMFTASGSRPDPSPPAIDLVEEEAEDADSPGENAVWSSFEGLRRQES
jgi:hypothetical protein